MLYCDLKLDNIGVLGEGRFVWLLDFGQSVDLTEAAGEHGNPNAARFTGIITPERTSLCPAMQEGRSWCRELDTHCVRAIGHEMIFGMGMKMTKNKSTEEWEIPALKPKYCRCKDDDERKLWEFFFLWQCEFGRIQCDLEDIIGTFNNFLDQKGRRAEIERLLERQRQFF